MIFESFAANLGSESRRGMGIECGWYVEQSPAIGGPMRDKARRRAIAQRMQHAPAKGPATACLLVG